jgi:hypothetical protein
MHQLPQSQKWGILILSAWLSTTLLTAFVAANLFLIISDVEQAGRMGMKMFGTYNYLEVIFALTLTLVTSLTAGKIKKILAIILLCISFSYVFYFTPGIKESTQRMHQWKGVDPEKHHYATEKQNFFHHTYVKIEKVKLLLLLVTLILVWRNPKVAKKIEEAP